jgi:hypothetical protein
MNEHERRQALADLLRNTLGHLEFEHVTLQLPSDPDVRLMIYTPNVATQAKLQRCLETVSATCQVHRSGFMPDR